MLCCDELHTCLYSWSHTWSTRQLAGSARLHAVLRDVGFVAGVARVKPLRGVRLQRIQSTTQSNHALPVAANMTMLTHMVIVTHPNKTGSNGSTCASPAEGWLYLAGGMVGHTMDTRMTTALVCGGGYLGTPALPSALASDDSTSPIVGLIIERRTTKPDGNSSGGTLKPELVHPRRYDRRAQARQEITKYTMLFLTTYSVRPQVMVSTIHN